MLRQIIEILQGSFSCAREENEFLERFTQLIPVSREEARRILENGGPMRNEERERLGLTRQRIRLIDALAVNDMRLGVALAPLATYIDHGLPSDMADPGERDAERAKALKYLKIQEDLIEQIKKAPTKRPRTNERVCGDCTSLSSCGLKPCDGHARTCCEFFWIGDSNQ